MRREGYCEEPENFKIMMSDLLEVAYSLCFTELCNIHYSVKDHEQGPSSMRIGGVG